jgi:hypothetical protein
MGEVPMRRWVTTFAGLSAALWAAGTSSAALAAEAGSWKRFVVPETSLAVDLPGDLFSESAGKPDRGEGRRFRTKDGRATLVIQSLRNAETDSPRSFLNKHFSLPHSAAVYRRVASDFFVVSGFHEGNIWYDRCNFVGSYIDCAALNYPASEKRNWDHIVTRISNTLTKR